MKLKTLKDLELGIGEHEEIRAEAVKWVKSDFVIQKYVKIYTAKDWIKHFFNITEEDLTK